MRALELADGAAGEQACDKFDLFGESEDVSGDGAVARTVLGSREAPLALPLVCADAKLVPLGQLALCIHPQTHRHHRVRTQAPSAQEAIKLSRECEGSSRLSMSSCLRGGLVFFVDDELFAGYLGGGADVVELRKSMCTARSRRRVSSASSFAPASRWP